jgi:phosphoglycolate phosphatase-like HAD superfamily hydrolase
MKKEKKWKKLQEKAEKPIILFSFDGTLLDTAATVQACYREVFAKFGGEDDRFTRERQLEVPGASVSGMLEKFLPNADPHKMLNVYDAYEGSHLIDLIQPRKGAAELLEWLKKEGWRMGIVSMRSRSSIVSLLQHARFASYFDMVLGWHSTDDLYLSSDDIRLACKLMHAGNAIVIGNCAPDIAAAKEAGAFTIGIAVGADTAPAMVAESPDFITSDLSQIRALLEDEPLWLAYHIYQEDELDRMEKEAEKKQRKKEEKAASKQKKKNQKEEEKAEKKRKKNEKSLKKKKASDQKKADKKEKESDSKKEKDKAGKKTSEAGQKQDQKIKEKKKEKSDLTKKSKKKKK